MNNTSVHQPSEAPHYQADNELVVEVSKTDSSTALYVSITDEEGKTEQFFLTTGQARRLADMLSKACA